MRAMRAAPSELAAMKGKCVKVTKMQKKKTKENKVGVISFVDEIVMMLCDL